jgi:hypothetical protein
VTAIATVDLTDDKESSLLQWKVQLRTRFGHHCRIAGYSAKVLHPGGIPFHPKLKCDAFLRCAPATVTGREQYDQYDAAQDQRNR